MTTRFLFAYLSFCTERQSTDEKNLLPDRCLCILYECTCAGLCVCVSMCRCATDLLIWRPTRADRDGICCMRGGAALLLSATLLWTHAHGEKRAQVPHTSTPHTPAHAAHTQHTNYIACGFSDAPPGLFLSICGDRMTILPPATRAVPRGTTHIQEHRGGSSAEVCRFPAEKKQHESCLSNWQNSRQQNKRGLLHNTQRHIYFVTPLPFCIINVGAHRVNFWWRVAVTTSSGMPVGWSLRWNKAKVKNRKQNVCFFFLS